MEGFKASDKCRPYFENSYGYAVFESIVKDGANKVGVASGEGTVYINTAETVDDIIYNQETGTSNMMQVSLGEHLGVETYAMVMFFETQQDYEKFATVGHHTFEFGAEAKVVAKSPCQGAKLTRMIQYAKGMAVFTQTHLGCFLYEATISGQNYSFTPVDN